ncbi:hypothetical protein [Actinomadura sp. WMMA1423]|uniref:hypothetical protein n=1 Tax=Actinomadura sp. WMMA1423 TaxID=2591108 RepID=UPI001146DCD5|nr:hypothetical protein [Actinomadura sp. WMMA1423]
MAGGAAQAGAVSVLLRRVAYGHRVLGQSAFGRCVRRLLVLGGLLIGGWLLGCAAQSAHADEPPPGLVTGVVANTPVLGDAVQAVGERQPLQEAGGVTELVEVVDAVAQEPPREQKAPRDVSPPRKDVGVAPAVKPEPRPHVARVAAAPERHRRLPAPRAFSQVRPKVGHVVRHVAVQPRPEPMPAPEGPGTHSVTGGFIATGIAVGFPATGTWVPAPQQASLRRVPGAVLPAVRTAADEPSFAPD